MPRTWRELWRTMTRTPLRLVISVAVLLALALTIYALTDEIIHVVESLAALALIFGILWLAFKKLLSL